MLIASFRDVAPDRILLKHHDMIVEDEGNNGRQAGKKHVPDEFFPSRLLLPLNSHGISPDHHFAGQRTQQNRESSNGPHAPSVKRKCKPSITASRRRATGSHPRITSEGRLFGIML